MIIIRSRPFYSHCFGEPPKFGTSTTLSRLMYFYHGEILLRYCLISWSLSSFRILRSNITWHRSEYSVSPLWIQLEIDSEPFKAVFMIFEYSNTSSYGASHWNVEDLHISPLLWRHKANQSGEVTVDLLIPQLSYESNFQFVFEAEFNIRRLRLACGTSGESILKFHDQISHGLAGTCCKRRGDTSKSNFPVKSNRKSIFSEDDTIKTISSLVSLIKWIGKKKVEIKKRGKARGRRVTDKHSLECSNVPPMS